MNYDKTIYFVSKNEMKFKEMRELWTNETYHLEAYDETIREIQDSSMEEIVKHKAKEAYKSLFRPVLVEHSGLFLLNYGNLPGGLTQVVWNSLTNGGAHPESFSNLFAPSGSTPAIAQSVLAYCDGKSVKLFVGEVHGAIIKDSRGTNGFGWDCVFQPDSITPKITFAEMDDSTKREHSMRTLAMDVFMKHLNEITPRRETYAGR